MINKNYNKDYTLTTSQDKVERDKERIKKNGEVFTPSVIVEEMMDMVTDETIWSDPSKTFLDPTFGNGNILVGILRRRLANGISPKDAVSTLFGTELMLDNVEFTRNRIAEEIGTHEYDDTIKHNLVCADVFKWHYDPTDWRQMTEEEIKEEEILKKKSKQKSKTNKALF